MKCWILILMVFLTGLSSVGEGVIAAPTQPVSTGDTRTTGGAQTAEPVFLFGPPSHTYRHNPITGTITALTENKVGYLGTADGSYPKVGDLYVGALKIGNVSASANTAVAADIVLPPNTAFAIDANDPDKQVECLLWNADTGEQWLLTGADCDQTPSPGRYGAHFAPSSSDNDGAWWLAPGEVLFIFFPITSRTELKGIFDSPQACMIGSVFAAGALGDGWDHPQPTDTCPLPDGHGASQGVFVAPGTPPPTVGPGTQAPHHKHKKKGKKHKKGKGKKH